MINSFYSKHESSKIVALDLMNELRNLKIIIMNMSPSNNGGGRSE